MCPDLVPMLTAMQSFEALPHYRQPHETLRDVDGYSIVGVRVDRPSYVACSQLKAVSISRRHSNDQPTPTLHAFTHALSSILAFLRETAEAIPPDMRVSPGADARLTALWTKYEDMENVLQALAALCGRVCAYGSRSLQSNLLKLVTRKSQWTR